MFGWKKKDKDASEETTATAGVETPPAAKAPAEKPKERAEAASSTATLETDKGFKVKVTERKGCTVAMTIQVPADRVQSATEEAFKDVQGRAKMPGFRAGKVPLEMVKKNFGDAAIERALDRLLRESVHQALVQEKIDAVATPMIDKVDYADKKPLKFEMRVECAPEVVVKDYKGLAITKKSAVVNEADVEKRIEELRETNSKLVESKDEAVSAKNFVVVDYEGSVDGKPIEGGKAEGQLIEMSAPQSIEGFNEGIMGAKAGETRDVPIKFPEDHPNKELAGKTISFKVTVTTIKEKQLPALDDDFAKDVGCESLEDLKTRIRKNMETELTRTVRQDLEKQLIEQLLEKHNFEVPPTLVEERNKHLNEQLKQYLLRQGASEQDWKANEGKMTEKNKLEAERQVRLSYVLAGIMEAEKFDVTDAEVEETILKSMDSVEPARRDEMKKWMEARKDNLRAQLREEKLFTWLIDNAQATDAVA